MSTTCLQPAKAKGPRTKPTERWKPVKLPTSSAEVPIYQQQVNMRLIGGLCPALYLQGRWIRLAPDYFVDHSYLLFRDLLRHYLEIFHWRLRPPLIAWVFSNLGTRSSAQLQSIEHLTCQNVNMNMSAVDWRPRETTNTRFHTYHSYTSKSPGHLVDLERCRWRTGSNTLGRFVEDCEYMRTSFTSCACGTHTFVGGDSPSPNCRTPD